MTKDAEKRRLARNAKAYESLGRFVEAFEGMVREARSISIRLLCKDSKMPDRRLVEVALHHPSLTAKPIFEIFRALVIEIVDLSMRDHEIRRKSGKGWTPLFPDFSRSDRNAFLGVMKTVAEEYLALTTMRNNLLHGAWAVGYESAIEFDIHKYAVGKEGLSRLELPTKASEILELRDRCEGIPPWLWKIEGCLTGMYKISDEFERKGKHWTTIAGGTTLPKKSA